jgi:hypothetical protein
MGGFRVNGNANRFQVFRKDGFEKLSHATVRDTWQANRNITGEILLAQGLEPLASVAQDVAKTLCETANRDYESGLNNLT